MATMYSRSYFSCTIHGDDDAVMRLVSFGGPIVQHSCAVQNSFMFVPEDGRNSDCNHGRLCLCQIRGTIFMYGWLDSGKIFTDYRIWTVLL